MCQICASLGLDPGASSAKPMSTPAGEKSLTRNADGTYSLRLTEAQMTNLLLRLAASIISERQA